MDSDRASLTLDHLEKQGEFDEQWEFISLGGNSSTNFGTGLSLNYRYKSNFSWKLFLDYDFSRKTFTLTADPFRYYMFVSPDLHNIYNIMVEDTSPITFRKRKNMHYLTIGGTFAINL